MDSFVDAEELVRMDGWWRAANYLSVGQIYLKDNPLLERPLTLEDVKPRLLGHWGTTPGLNFIYVHMNRAIPVERGALLWQQMVDRLTTHRAYVCEFGEDQAEIQE
ncbi:MAG: hypothetical protein JZL64_02865 [Ferrovum myxofaciens]|uniref:Xylulose-5-phosphate/fructose-6-phosphate phosphoketolase n=1 Tax=mine drainage metagenome TaxID=410659 RepID=A0A3P3ZLH6_9ZZZZ|nr:hypothetical protein [Ferrovum myxofaciens]MBU6993960.1 hypothetical protein [Ferrovum myxofaciens]